MSPLGTILFEGVTDSRHPGPGARGRLLDVKIVTGCASTKIVTKIGSWVRWTFWAERRAAVFRGERDLHSEVGFFGIRLGWGEAIFRRYWRTKGHLRPGAREGGLGHGMQAGVGKWGTREGPGKEESKKEPYTPLLGRNPFTVTPE